MPLIKDPSAKEHIIFELLDDILVFNKCARDKIGWNKVCNKNELQSIERILNKFSELEKPKKIHCNFYDLYTIDNFKKYCHRKQWIWVPCLLAPFLSKLIAKDYIYKYLSQEIVDSNRARTFLKPILEKQYQETGDPFWLSRIFPLRDPFIMKYNYPILLLKTLIYSSVASMMGVVYGGINFLKPTIASDGLFATMSTMGGLSIFFGFVSFGGKEILLRNIPKIMIPLLEHPLLSIGCLTGFYAFMVALYNVKQMRTPRTEMVSFAELSALLKRTDIVIE